MGSRHSNLHIGLCIALFLAAPAAVAAGASADTPVQMADSTSDLDDWNAIKTSKSADDYQNYLTKHPDGAFADLAKLRIKQYAPAPAAAAPATPAAPAVDPQMAELHDWNAIKDSKNAIDFETFLKKSPNGNFRDLANLLLTQLNAVAQPAA
ncbi:MAG: hypothetical protein ABUL54_05705, partial [Dongia sp.]